ncbi:Trans-aconitate 2-methyltransferase [Andreprevotia sp. IGB-42]|uniref:class I SAM-dependent methyltransferase n=1 Tax=Andreprevotia sp. IGB-42 TaxID=2497473 RepID=UPI00135BE414|nr:class I SAM-dependent methyltransferase [Andreprevotia sp. IGB-42]KAF0815042.1 Trans-aconitate 2-methyltransferase [Andreprevotia sp. IGB-42]
MQNWHAIWNRRQGELGSDALQSLIELDGFDAGAGRIIAADWRAYVHLIAQRLHLQAGQGVYEVGCGAGAFLYALQELGVHIGGLDYSASLVAKASEVMPDGDFTHGEAVQMPLEPVYDVVLANSVFHYFPDQDYAAQVLQRMLDKATRMVAILEVPDLASRDEAERIRRDSLSPSAYEEKYRGLAHFYYDRSWFADFAAQRGYHCQVFDQCIPNYAQSPFRFNCLITK